VHFRCVLVKILPKNLEQHIDWGTQDPWSPSGYALAHIREAAVTHIRMAVSHIWHQLGGCYKRSGGWYSIIPVAVTYIPVASSFQLFEPDVVCSVSVIHVFRRAGPPQQVDCLAPRWKIALKGY